MIARDYSEVERDDTSACNLVLGDAQGRRLVDIHVIVRDVEGNGLYGLPEKGVMYPAASLTGRGTIGGQSVRCISPEWMVKFHSGYTLHGKDLHDVARLCAKFGIELPAEYGAFKA